MTNKILFVDDELNVLEGIRRQLRRRFEIETAVSAQQGLALIDSHRPYAVVISDFNMPVMNGEEMLNKMREQDELHDIPVVVVSTEGSKTRIERLAELGARFVHKPWTAEKLCGTVIEATGVTLKTYEQETA